MIYIKQKNQMNPTKNMFFLLLIFVSQFPISPVFAESMDPDTGRDIFFKHCKACHGVKGDGQTFAANVLNPPPKNFTTKKSKKDLTQKRMLQSVTEGRKNTAMMPWKSRLTKKEIQAVVNYIREELMNQGND